MTESFRQNPLYKFSHILIRAAGGVRRRPWLHLLSTLTLTAAFLSFGATLTAAVNLNGLLQRWVGNSEMTVYVKRSTSEEDIQKLHSAITAINGVQSAVILMPTQARENFARDLGSYSDIGASLPESAFSPSIDIFLSPDLSNDKTARHALATRLSKVHMIEEVELYDDWFDRLSAVSTMGRTSAWGLGILAAVVAILVVAATVRTGVSARRREISVLRYVGATEAYVRTPFLIEGAVEASLAMALAVFGLDLLMDHVDSVVGSILPLLGGGRILRLEVPWLLSMMFGSLLAGLIGARLSLRKLETP